MLASNSSGRKLVQVQLLSSVPLVYACNEKPKSGPVAPVAEAG